MAGEVKHIKFDYSKLRGRIVEVYGNLANYCRETGKDRSILSTKLHNGESMRQTLTVTIAKELNIPETEYKSYFFTPRVEKSELEE